MRAAVPFILCVLSLMLGLESATGAKSKIKIPGLKINIGNAPASTTQRPTPRPKITIKTSQTDQSTNDTYDCFKFEKPSPWTWVEARTNGSVTFRCQPLERLCTSDWPAKLVTMNVKHLYKNADECRIGMTLEQEKSKQSENVASTPKLNTTEVVNATRMT